MLKVENGPGIFIAVFCALGVRFWLGYFLSNEDAEYFLKVLNSKLSQILFGVKDDLLKLVREARGECHLKAHGNVTKKKHSQNMKKARMTPLQSQNLQQQTLKYQDWMIFPLS